MNFRTIETEARWTATLLRFLPPARHPLAGAELRSELIELIRAEPTMPIVVDFSEYPLYPAEVLLSLADAHRFTAGGHPWLCLDMPLRLQVVCRFLRFDDRLFACYSTLHDALSAAAPQKLPLPLPAGYRAAAYAA